MANAKILWADDEIDLLKAHIMFLNEKGYSVDSVSNGQDAIDKFEAENYDIVFLDENMPGISGLEALTQIKEISPHTPVVMITKSEEESIMEDAIGQKISDYLIKPVNPKQILLACKRLLQNRELVDAKVNRGYQQDFAKIGMQFYEDTSYSDWIDIYKKLTNTEVRMEQNDDKSMLDVLTTQQVEANTNFGRFVKRNYLDWLHTKDVDRRPLLSPEVLKYSAFNELGGKQESIFFILVDCLRYDQWKEFEKVFAQYFYVEKEQMYYGILPTATQYSRNSIFAGLHPGEIAKKHPRYWKDDNEEGGKNQFESNLLKENIQRNHLNIKHSYHKILNNDQGQRLSENFNNLMNNDLNVIVYNFIDALSHSRTDVNIIRELAPNEAAYRSVSRSWLEHSPLLDLIKQLSEANVKVVLTTDHGTIRVKRPVKIIGDRDTTTNLRYKQGKNLSYDDQKYLFTIHKPEEAFLPKMTVSSTYVFTMDDYFFAYPNNYNHYVKYYKDTFQHGGISMEEMMVPLITLLPKR